MVTIHLKRPWIPPNLAFCVFDETAVQATTVSELSIRCVSPKAWNAGPVNVRLSSDSTRRYGSEEIESLPFVYYAQVLVESVSPTLEGIEVKAIGLNMSTRVTCRVGFSMRPGVMVDDETVRCPLPAEEEEALVPHGTPSNITLPPPRGGLNLALPGAVVAIRGAIWPQWYLQLNSSDIFAAPRVAPSLNTSDFGSAPFLVVCGKTCSSVAFYNEEFGRYLCPGKSTCFAPHPLFNTMSVGTNNPPPQTQQRSTANSSNVLNLSTSGNILGSNGSILHLSGLGPWLTA